MDAAVAGSQVNPPQPSHVTFEDGLGERRYTTSPVNEPLESLRVSSLLSAVSSFDFALRERAARLANFRHDAYARVRSVELDRRTSALLVVSDFVPGVRLSTILTGLEERSTILEINVARCIIRQLVHAAAALQTADPDVANGALGAGRIVITPAGRVVIAEYVLGAALEQLGYSRARYWKELSIALPATSPTVSFDARTDVTQIGIIALSLVLGRPLTTDEYHDRLWDLVQRSSIRTVIGSFEPMPAGLREWISRALQLDPQKSFASPAEARDALDEGLGDENAVAELGALQVFMAKYAAREAPTATAADLGPRLDAMKAFLARYPSRRAPSHTEPATSQGEVAPPIAPEPAAVQESPVTPPSYAEERRGATPVVTWGGRRIALIAGAALLVALAVAAAFFLPLGGASGFGTLSVSTTPPGVAVFIDDMPFGVTPLGVELPPGDHLVELRAGTEQRRIPITLVAGSQMSQHFEFAKNTTTTAAAAAGELLVRTDPASAAVIVDGQYVGRSPVSVPDLTPGTHTVVLQHESGTLTERVLIETGRTASLVVSMGAAAQKTAAAGWIRLEAPADVQVFEDGRLLGSSDIDRIMLPVGRHDLDIVNGALGFRERRVVQVTAGQVVTVRPKWPEGSLALNAIPWAEVFVDGQRVGETPIGRVTVPAGQHEVVFRHPELGERRVSVTVMATGEPIKVGVDLRAK